MPGIVIGFNDTTNEYFSKLFTQINSIEPLITSIIPHISLMRFQDMNDVSKISSILKNITFTDFKVNIKGISIYRKSDSKFVLVLDPYYDKNISNIHLLLKIKIIFK